MNYRLHIEDTVYKYSVQFTKYLTVPFYQNSVPGNCMITRLRVLVSQFNRGIHLNVTKCQKQNSVT